jgi:hypothetical protein
MVLVRETPRASLVIWLPHPHMEYGRIQEITIRSPTVSFPPLETLSHKSS